MQCHDNVSTLTFLKIGCFPYLLFVSCTKNSIYDDNFINAFCVTKKVQLSFSVSGSFQIKESGLDKLLLDLKTYYSTKK